MQSQKPSEKFINILKGIFVIIISIPISLFIYLKIVFLGFGGDLHGSDNGGLALFVGGGVFLFFLIIAIRFITRPVENK